MTMSGALKCVLVAACCMQSSLGLLLPAAPFASSRAARTSVLKWRAHPLGLRMAVRLRLRSPSNVLPPPSSSSSESEHFSLQGFGDQAEGGKKKQKGKGKKSAPITSFPPSMLKRSVCRPADPLGAHVSRGYACVQKIIVLSRTRMQDTFLKTNTKYPIFLHVQ